MDKENVMKYLIAVISLIVSGAVFAQQGVDMNQMMEKMAEMQKCMAQIDQSKMQQYQEESEAFGRELKNLCTAGKRDQAQNRAMDYALRIRNSTELQQVRQCMALMQGMPGMPQPRDFASLVEETKQKHVCDAM